MRHTWPTRWVLSGRAELTLRCEFAVTLDDVEREVRRLAAVIGAPDAGLPTFGSSIDGGHPHVELDGPVLSWVVRERGRELTRRSTRDPDELLYWVFEQITFAMAIRWVGLHRRAEEQYRAQLWRRQFELLGAIDTEWSARRARELGPLLAEVGLEAPARASGDGTAERS